MQLLRPDEFRTGDRVLIEAEQAEGEALLHLLGPGTRICHHRMMFRGILKNGEACGLAWWYFDPNMEYEVTR